MYGEVAPVLAPVAAAAVVSQLPNTGSNIWVTVAVSVAAGLVAWALVNKQRAAQV
jgi:LPXTG-motif cell wall-anchored protein